MPATRFVWRLGVPVRPDHVYRITAEYDNPTGLSYRVGCDSSRSLGAPARKVGGWPRTGG
jgi:hypothetical protein